MTSCPRALSIAGSDSSGGAGIQADLKTFTAHRVWGATVITALTAQNTSGVRAVWIPEPEFVVQQYDAVLDEAPIGAAKTGMLGNGRVLRALCRALDRRPLANLVVDPVLVATSGALLYEQADVSLYLDELIPRASVITPNIPEIKALTGISVDSEADMERAARQLHACGAAAVLVKGGHLSGPRAMDLLFDGEAFHRLEGPRFEGRCTHGTGCTLSAAIAANLAGGMGLLPAVRAAREYTSRCIEFGFGGTGPGGGLNHFHGLGGGSGPA